MRPDDRVVPEFSKDQKLFQESSQYEYVAMVPSFWGGVRVRDLKTVVHLELPSDWPSAIVEESTEIAAGRIAGIATLETGG